MEWYQIISTIIVPVLSVIGAGGIISALMKRRWDRQDKQAAEKEEEQLNKRKEQMREVFREEITCVEDKMHKLNSAIDKQGEQIEKMLEADDIHKASLQAVLRDRLYQLNRYCTKKKFTTQDERDNFNNMYDKYHQLRENGVMDVTREKFMNLPFQEEYEAENNKVNQK